MGYDPDRLRKQRMNLLIIANGDVEKARKMQAFLLEPPKTWEDVKPAPSQKFTTPYGRVDLFGSDEAIRHLFRTIRDVAEAEVGEKA